MKNILSRRHLGAIITSILIGLFLISGHAKAVSNITIGKYRVGVITSPFSGAAVWKTTGDLYECRYANQSELLSILAAVENKDQGDAIKHIEGMAVTRKLTDTENAFCLSLIKITSSKVLKAVPSKAGTRRTRDLNAINYLDMRVPDTVLCEGQIVKKYQTNKNWYKVKDVYATTLCGEY